MQRRRFLNSAFALGLTAPLALRASEAPEEARELSADVVIVGSGAAGLSAAVSALQSGARRVALLEKAPLLGGHSILSTGSVSVAFPDAETGARDENIERFVRDTLEAGGPESDPELVRLLAQKSYDAVIWLIQLGVRWNLEPFRAVSSTAVRNISTGSVRAGYDYVQTLLSAAKRLGVEIHYRTRAEALLTEAGRVTGVLARGPRGEALRFRAPAIVLATGGFTANPVMRRRFDPRLHEGLRTTANPEGQTLDGATGDGIAMAEKIGAKTVGMPHIQLIPFIGGRVTDYAGAEVWVNARGEALRFRAPAIVLATGGFTANPVMRRRFDPRLHEGLRTTANPEGQTLDGATGDGIAMAEKIGAKTVGMPHIQLIPFIGGRVTDYAGAEVWVNARGERFVNEEERFGTLYEAILQQPDARFWVITDSQSKKNATFGPKLARGAVRAAANLEEVAQAMEIPEAKLRETLRRYNEAVDRNRDDLFGRTVFTQRIDTPPYYFGEERFAVHFTCGGLAIDAHARVLDRSGNPIPGLFAAGETTGGIHGKDRLGGNSLIDCFVFGRIAGEKAAAGRK